jgi:hypothetical protein
MDDSDVFGFEFVAAANLRDIDRKIEGRVFIPQDVASIRTVLATTDWGLGHEFYFDAPLRAVLTSSQSAVLTFRVTSLGPKTEASFLQQQGASDGGAEALIQLLKSLARDSGHPELEFVPLVFFGHSAGTTFGLQFATIHPEQTVALIRYHFQGIADNLDVLSKIPILFLVGGKDSASNLAQVRETQQRGRSAGAPWTLAIEPNATHGDSKDLTKAYRLLTPWVSAVLRLRGVTTGSSMIAATESPGWLANLDGTGMAPFAEFAGPRQTANWLPDETAGRAWLSLTGVGN